MPALIAEFIGTFALIFIGAGAICADAMTGGGLGIVGIALAHGLTIMVMVYAFGHISGGHFNPAVTFAMAITKQIKPDKAGSYVIAQLAGGAAAAFLLAQMYGEYMTHVPYLGATMINFSAVTIPGAIVVEAILTFFLVTVIYAMAVDGRSSKPAIGLAIGLTITLDILMGGPLTGASMNPARTFGPALATGNWADHWVYWVGPLAGGGLAGLLYENTLLKRGKKEGKS